MSDEEKFENFGAVKFMLDEIDRCCYKHIGQLDVAFHWPSKTAFGYARWGATLTMSGPYTMAKLKERVDDALGKLNELNASLTERSAILAEYEKRLDPKNGREAYFFHLDHYDESRQGNTPFHTGIPGLCGEHKDELDKCPTGVKDAVWLWNLYSAERDLPTITEFIAPRASYMTELVRVHKTMNYATHVPPKLTDVARFRMMLHIAHHLKNSSRVKPKKQAAAQVGKESAKKARVEHDDDDE